MNFGELINKSEKVVIVFKKQGDVIEQEKLLGFEEEKCYCATIDIEKNRDLCKSLGVKETPEYLFYHFGQLVLRNKSGMFFSIN